MRRVAIVQARLDSKRLPRKVLADIHGKPMLWHVMTRASAASTIDEVVLATPDKELAALVEGWGFSATVGPRTDVLLRLLLTARENRADVVVRLTGDCPLLDPSVIDECVDALGNNDYASNVIYRSYPKGMDVEVMPLDTLLRVERMAKSFEHREHVTLFIRENPLLFECVNVDSFMNFSHLRWCVDTPEDLEYVRKVFVKCGNEYSYKTILGVLHGKTEPVATFA